MLNELDNIPTDTEDKKRTEGEYSRVVNMNVADEVDYEYTSLKPYVEMFEKHVAAVLRDARLVKKGESCQSV